MIAALENLIALQRLDLQIRALRSRLNRIPKEIDALEKEIASEKANLKEAEDRVAEAQKQRRAFEGDLQQLEERLGKYKDQLMQVKSNDEYRAMQKQIETVKEEIGKKEEDILVGMDEADALQSQVWARKQELNEGQKRVEAMEGELKQEEAKLRAELDKETAEREKLLSAIDPKLLESYQRVSGARGGVAVAEAKDEHCQVCHVRLRPQIYSELRMGDKIIHCESCDRILYYRETPAPGATASKPDRPTGNT